MKYNEEEAMDVLLSYAEMLEDGKGTFRDNMSKDMKKGKFPKGRGFEIVVNILTDMELKENKFADPEIHIRKQISRELNEARKVLDRDKTKIIYTNDNEIEFNIMFNLLKWLNVKCKGNKTDQNGFEQVNSGDNKSPIVFIHGKKFEGFLELMGYLDDQNFFD